MIKKIFAFLLIFSTISLIFGQDLNTHLKYLNEEYGVNIEENTKNVINNVFGFNIIEELENIFFNWEKNFFSFFIVIK